MALFRRSAPTPAIHPVTDFWMWWSSEGQTLSPHEASAVTDELTRRVATIHADLTWHFGPGADAEHRLTVSASGIAEVRPSAERWLRAAPSAGPTWEFRSSQEADPDALRQILDIAGQTVDLSQTVFRLDTVEDELRAHVGVFHPTFSAMPQPARQQVTYLVLDWLLGEDDVERWLGHIEALDAPPSAAVDGDAVLTAVRSIASVADPEEWTLAQWQENDGAPGIASFRRGLRWLDFPTFDRHHQIAASYDAQPNGLPADAAALEVLRDHEDSLLDALGNRGILVGHETCRGVRTFHVYTDGEDANTAEFMREWARSRHLKEAATADPSWRSVRHFTG